MTKTNQKLELRIASLPLAKAEREKALAYVRAGESLAEAAIALMSFLNGRATPVLNQG